MFQCSGKETPQIHVSLWGWHILPYTKSVLWLRSCSRKSSWVNLSSTDPNGNLNLKESDVILGCISKSSWLPRSCLILLRSWRSQPQPGWPRRWPPPRGPWGWPGWPGRSRRGAPARQPGRASAVTAQGLGYLAERGMNIWVDNPQNEDGWQVYSQDKCCGINAIRRGQGHAMGFSFYLVSCWHLLTTWLMLFAQYSRWRWNLDAKRSAGWVVESTIKSQMLFDVRSSFILQVKLRNCLYESSLLLLFFAWCCRTPHPQSIVNYWHWSFKSINFNASPAASSSSWWSAFPLVSLFSSSASYCLHCGCCRCGSGRGCGPVCGWGCGSDGDGSGGGGVGVFVFVVVILFLLSLSLLSSSSLLLSLFLF